VKPPPHSPQTLPPFSDQTEAQIWLSAVVALDKKQPSNPPRRGKTPQQTQFMTETEPTTPATPPAQPDSHAGPLRDF